MQSVGKHAGQQHAKAVMTELRVARQGQELCLTLSGVLSPSTYSQYQANILHLLACEQATLMLCLNPAPAASTVKAILKPALAKHCAVLARLLPATDFTTNGPVLELPCPPWAVLDVIAIADQPRLANALLNGGKQRVLHALLVCCLLSLNCSACLNTIVLARLAEGMCM